MSKIPHKRLLFYTIIAGLLPLAVICINYFSKEAQYTALLQRLASDRDMAVRKSIVKSPNREIRKRYQGKDSCYTSKRIEPIPLLTKETAELQKLLQMGYHPQEEILRKRYDFLMSGQNALAFSEMWVKKYPGFSETQEVLNHAVEVDVEDLFTILSKIEAVTEDSTQDSERPQMFISDCKIERKKGALQETYLLQLKCIKREFFR